MNSFTDLKFDTAVEKIQHFCGTRFPSRINALAGQGQETGTLLLTPIAGCELIKSVGEFTTKPGWTLDVCL